MKRIEIPLIERKDNNSITRADIIKKVSRIADLYKRSEVSALWYKYQNNIEFTKDDLITLYDIFNEDYMLNENKKKFINLMCNGRKKLINFDMAKIFDCSVEEIASNQFHLKKNPSRYVVLLDSLDIYYADNYQYKNLKYIRKCCSIMDMLSTKDILPKLESIGGELSIFQLSSCYEFKTLKSIGDDAYLSKLQDASGLCNLEIIGGNAVFNSLKDARGLSNLRIIDGNAEFDDLVDLSDLTNLEYIGRTWYFNSLSDDDRNTLKKRLKKVR